MFLLLEMTSQNSLFGGIPESLEVLIFGVGLVLLAVGLRSIMHRGESGARAALARPDDDHSRLAIRCAHALSLPVLPGRTGQALVSARDARKATTFQTPSASADRG